MAVGQSSSFSDIPNNTSRYWYKDRGLKANVTHCLGLCCVIYYLGYDASLLNGLQAIRAWEEFMHYPTGNLLGLYAASFFLPTIFTAYIGDYCARRLGRIKTVALGTLIILAGSLINALATNPGMWVAGRAIIGAGGGIAKVATPALIQEIAHPRLRPTLACCYYPFFYFGSLFSALFCFAGLYIPNSWSWRLPSIIQVVGPIVVLITLLRCPESPRWFISVGRREQALAVLAKYHANGVLDDPLVQWELGEMEAALAQEQLNHQVSYSDFFKTSGNRRRLMVLISLSVGSNWVGNGVISYYLTPVLQSVGITSAVQITLLTSGLAIWNLILSLFAALHVERFGRRPLFLISIAGMLASYAFVMGFSAGFAESHKASLGIAVIPFLFLYFGFYDIAWTPLPVPYTAEILPFNMRTKGLALFTSTGTLANAFNQFVNPIALKKLHWKYYAVYIAILIFYFVLAYIAYPETKNHTIEEVSMIFDKQNADIKHLGEQAIQEVEKGTTEHFEHQRANSLELKAITSHQSDINKNNLDRLMV
ncbi:sugar transporter [Cryptococcus neoformans Tu401-1]|uniref:Sugar transporter n=1 Tax=Cryptococcus neoformans Tu259-1 TaxID=1230072 RepID=A0A854QND9_CRYNE|nr:sugar transporter [Cryptococcus neoformans var. grubii Bt85]OXG20168.1 sugar transporter [Cryptococcus neoformans var. grubii Tu401-1]OXG24463.1 sugar transporter [Cryptococcus neoformans var. grubii Tu259-1]OXG43649.1 sugar transporter [Cryptococcus neoformans var. grubii Bt120]OXM80200.1 sugar transporter [Cryptococcus neoformans var. grubii Bt63]